MLTTITRRISETHAGSIWVIIGLAKNIPTTDIAMDKRPRIGITMRIDFPAERFYLSRHYSEAIEAAGGAPVHISLIPSGDYIRALVAGLDGVLLPGSDSDVDPLRYGQEPH